MLHPKELLIQDFTYDLPSEKIAKYPLAERDQSKLLVYKNNQLTTSTYLKLPDFLADNSVLVFNDTRVLEARLLFQKPGGAFIEIFCLEPAKEYPDITIAMLQKGAVRWKCLVGKASKWKPGSILQKKVARSPGELVINAAISGHLPGCFIISFSWSEPEMSFSEMLHHAGSMPLPPYLHRAVEDSDKERYQTIYARQDGSVAAPTAGLHFTEHLFARLNQKTYRNSLLRCMWAPALLSLLLQNA